MATVLARPPLLPERANTPPAPKLSLNTSQRGPAAPVPNKHLPYCSPGPQPTSAQLDTPATSPPSPSQWIETTSALHPPNASDKIADHPPVYAIKAQKLAQALDHLATQPLPGPSQVFPWLHGLHAENQLQLAFFISRKRVLRRTPKCIRGMTIIKAGNDLSHSKIKGAILADEILRPVQSGRKEEQSEFYDADPKDGFNVRNFQIQACKMATVSDIVVYGDNQTPRVEVVRLAKRIAQAQTAWNRKTEGMYSSARIFNTFVLSDDYTVVEADQPDIIALDSQGGMTNKVMDFFHWERQEMCTMSAPTEIAKNVWLGPTPDVRAMGAESAADQPEFDIYVEANDMAQIPDERTFKALEELLEKRTERTSSDGAVHQLEFPGSGAIMPPTWSQTEVDGLLEMCEWLHRQAHFGPQSRKRRDSKFSLSPEQDVDGDSFMSGMGARSPRSGGPGRRILIHCTDGYTESSLLGLAYYMYANCAPVHEAWLELHRSKGRNFFAYTSDVHLLKAIQPRLLQASPRYNGNIRALTPELPEWLDKMDGSLPSRVLPYMYLGNLGHANNPGLLRELGIGQILSVGEPISWSREVAEEWPEESLLYVDRVQDNGVDPLTEEFGRCLNFIESGRKKGTATLVHCRVGVSRSATICIAEVMNELGLSFPRAYCFVRARRLNVIIQPHLRFSYELLKWEEFQCQKRGRPLRRELEWATIAREIAAMNKPYSRG